MDLGLNVRQQPEPVGRMSLKMAQRLEGVDIKAGRVLSELYLASFAT